ncbi:uncharacterized protein BO80DRAFT_501369 [Aspergillus ibericus CBS 121593]|uniref:Uncharacterized protein n=1 Tax=Aspergillus ibericus CBS 121593 TaxID=1448316 RepID=A0A395H1R7_9EURO|nr:hypothetical protein BO80DRAFT_501369 [Aspergillus ibericus CBS 121593]RAL01832.1 hypothetical protein BO80DRAFT_501369 [Aspergillus ibericus CBS 121593]
MKLTPSLLLLPTLLASTASCTPEPLSDTDAANWSALAQALKPYTITIPTKTASLNLENIPPPPHTVIHQVITAVPPTALAQLFVPAKRSALASEFQAGNTPDWYKTLPTDVKSYISVVKRGIASGTETGMGTVKETGVGKGSSSSSGGVKGRGEVGGRLGVGIGVGWMVVMLVMVL